MNAREKLERELEENLETYVGDLRVVVEWILADRARIVEPLVKYKNDCRLGLQNKYEHGAKTEKQVIDEAIKLSGV